MDNQDRAYFNRLYRIWAISAFGAGTVRLAEISAGFSSAEEMYKTLTGSSAARSSFPDEVIRAADGVSLSAAEAIIEHCDKHGIDIITEDDDEYPERLKNVYAAPTLLFVKGDICGIDNHLSIAVVGTRNPCNYSLRVTAGIVSALSRHGFDIVSGFAEGIDICAHMSAVKSGGRTFAVLGCGLDVNYPRANEKYRELICENGALISEYLPSTPPLPFNFPVRNRIIAGLSAGTAVIEAGAKSGSLNTASHCISQGKSVFVVPPNDLFDVRYRGNVELIRDGAAVLMGARDIYNEYSVSAPHTIVANNAINEKLRELKKISEEADKADKSASSAERRAVRPKAKEHRGSVEGKNIPLNSDGHMRTLTAEEISEAASDDMQKIILEKLSAGGTPMRADELAQVCCAEIGDILTALTELEISGIISAEGGCYGICIQT